MSILLIISHLGTFLLGAVSAYLLARLEGQNMKGPRVSEPLDPNRSPLRERMTGRGPTPGAVLLIVLLAALVIVGFGIQQAWYQSQDAANDAREDTRMDCIKAWGEDLVATINTRTTGNARVEAAKIAREEAVDAVLLYAGQAFQRGGGNEAELRAGWLDRLLAFRHAKQALVEITARNEERKVDNPYPKLNC